ncbi:MAG TPA: DNA polymerase/3'-5' exonuclease PolX [Deltaproteobacteria bacterium]|nr:DNA polymerase/3'-5' exonuclease PolX [Deltaproteobacteria bacterium]
MDKREIIAALEEMGELLEIEGENPFRCRAYLNAARLLEGLPKSPAELLASGALAEMKGIGSGLLEKITEMISKGKSSFLNELRRKISPGLLELLRIPGLGPKKAKILHDKLNLNNLAELEYACTENRLIGLKGFGEKSQENILKGIELLKKSSGRFLFDAAWTGARELLSFLKKDKNVRRAEIAGSLRRCKETIGDIDLLVGMAEGSEALMKKFVQVPQAETVLAQGPTKSSIRLKSGIQVDLRVVTETEFPAALLYFTGNKEHNTELRGLAKDKGLKLNEYGLFRGEKALPCKEEADIYKALGLHYIPPEAREGEGEIAYAAKHPFPRLVEWEDLRGVFHVHSEWSDGKASILEMGREAERLGYTYMGLSDHSQTAAYAGGLKPADLQAQRKEIDDANQKLKKLKIIQGIESDILADGSLDYPAKVLDRLDFVIASVHQRFKMEKDAMTQRLVKAVSDPHTKILGHISGRLLLGREAYDFDHDAVFAAAAKHKVAIEINANPHRFDLDWRFLQQAKAAGVKFCINPDAHSINGLSDTRFGIGIARKGWLTREDILNTKSLEEIREYFKS